MRTCGSGAYTVAGAVEELVSYLALRYPRMLLLPIVFPSKIADLGVMAMLLCS